MPAEAIPLILLAAGISLTSYVLCGVAGSLNILADPVSPRSNHDGAASRAGGIVIFAIVFALAGIALIAGAPGSPPFFAAVVAATLLGAADDFRPLPAIVKLAALIAISILIGILTGAYESLPLPWGGAYLLPQPVGLAISAAFAFFFINAFNFMDGLNGMAAASGLVGCLVCVVLLGVSDIGLTFLLAVATAALFGFAVRNVLRGRVFLGDAGSLGLGAMLAGTALSAERQAEVPGLAIFIVAFIPYCLDVVLTLARRSARRASLLEPHKEHFYQLLRARGMSHEGVAGTYLALIGFSGLSAITLARLIGATGLWLAALIAVVVYLGSMFWLLRRSPLSVPAADGGQSEINEQAAQG